MKKLIFISLCALVANPMAITMDKPEKPSVILGMKNIAINTSSSIVDTTFKFMYNHPFITAMAIAPLIPAAIAPFRRAAIKHSNSDNGDTALLIIGAGLIVRANLLHIFSHQYLKERGIKHEENRAFLLATDCSCDSEKKLMIQKKT